MLSRAGQKGAGQCIRASIPYVRADIPILIIFRALGFVVSAVPLPPLGPSLLLLLPLLLPHVHLCASCCLGPLNVREGELVGCLAWCAEDTGACTAPAPPPPGSYRLRASGSAPLQADKDILEHIVYDFGDTAMMEMLRPSIEEAFPIQSQASRRAVPQLSPPPLPSRCQRCGCCCRRGRCCSCCCSPPRSTFRVPLLLPPPLTAHPPVGLSLQEVALDYIGKRGSTIGATKDTRIQYARELLQKELLPHIGMEEFCETKKVSGWAGRRPPSPLPCRALRRVQAPPPPPRRAGRRSFGYVILRLPSW